LQSPLWKLIGPTPPTATLYQETLDALVLKLGLYQATMEEVSIAGFGPNELARSPVFLLDDWSSVRKCALEIAQLGTIDSITLLCCAYHLAVARVSLLEADAYLPAIPHALRAWKKTWRANEEVTRPLIELIDARVVREDFSRLDPRKFGFVGRRKEALDNQLPTLPSRRPNGRVFCADPRPPIYARDRQVEGAVRMVKQTRHNLIKQAAQLAPEMFDRASPEYAKDLASTMRIFSAAIGSVAGRDVPINPLDLEWFWKDASLEIRPGAPSDLLTLPKRKGRK